MSLKQHTETEDVWRQLLEEIKKLNSVFHFIGDTYLPVNQLWKERVKNILHFQKYYVQLWGDAWAREEELGSWPRPFPLAVCLLWPQAEAQGKVRISAV